MPSSPTPAQAEASRRNGALSRGPATPEGRARSSGNAARHGLRGGFRLLDGEDAAEFRALADALAHRHAPADAAERHWVEELAFAAWRQRRLRALEDAALGRRDTDEPDADPPAPPSTPSLATLARYRARVERDWRHALAALRGLRAGRPRGYEVWLNAGKSAADLRWIADRLDERVARAMAEGTDEPEPAPEPRAAEPAPCATHDTRPTAPEAPLASTAPRTHAPPPPRNRHERRRLAALRQRGRRKAA